MWLDPKRAMCNESECSYHSQPQAEGERMVNPKAEDNERDDLENLLRAAHRYADGRKAGLSKDQLDALRLELAWALKMMDDDSRS
jgi:hypothetical protein